MASAGSIFVDLLLNDSRYAAGINRASRTTSTAANAWQRDVNKTRDSFAAVLNPVDNITAAVSRLGGVVAGALSVQKLVQYSDTWKQLEGRLSLVSDQFGSIGNIQGELFEIAQRTRQPLEGITNFYSRLAQFIPEAERAQYDLLGVTESVSTALAITGETSASSTAAMIQFTQAIGTNFEAAGQELRSLQEQAPRLTQALMKALGDGTKSLQQLKEEGLLTRESVLRALSGAGEEGRRLAEELAKVPVTAGQAFVQLDNALLKYIGQSELANGATNSFSAGIVGLANNIDIVANVIVGASAVMASRFIPGIVGSTTAFVAATREALRYQQALAAVSILNGRGAASFGLLTASMNLARGAGAGLLALVGGPFGAAFLAAGAGIAYLWQQMDQAKLVSQDYAEKSSRLFQIQNELTKASSARSIALKKERDDILAVALAEIKRTEASLKYLEIAQRANEQGGGIFGIGLSAGMDVKEKQTRERLAAQYSELDQLNSELNRMINEKPVDSTGSPVGKPSKESEKAAKKALEDQNRLYERNREIILGLDKDVLKYMDTEKELDKLFKAKRLSVDEYYTALSNLDAQYDETSNKTKTLGFDLEEFGKEASRSLQNTFADFFLSADEGFDGLRKGFAKALAEIAANAAATNLARLLFGESDSKSGGGAGGLLGGLFSKGGFFSEGGGGSSILSSVGDFFGGFFADGGYLAPGKFGIAGENEAELIYGGKTGVSVFNQDQLGRGGGNTYNIDARGADQSAIARLEQSIIALAGPGVIENRVQNAQTRGVL